MSGRMERFWLLAWEFSWGLFLQGQVCASLVVREHFKAEISAAFTSQCFLQTKNNSGAADEMIKPGPFVPGASTEHRRRMRMGRVCCSRVKHNFCGSFARARSPIPPCTPTGVRAPLGALCKPWGADSISNVGNREHKPHQTLLCQPRALHWILSQLPRLEGIQGCKHQLLIHGL